MAQRVTVVLVDDLDGTDATSTVTFGLDGTNYEIDLNDANAQALRDALARYVGAGRKVAGKSGGRARRAAATGGPNPREVRDWARSNGYEVSDRGRVPADIIAAFEAAR